MFYVTSDDEFIIKTVMHKEAEFLQKLLPGYYMVSGPSRPAPWHVPPSSPPGTPTLLRSGSLTGPLSLTLRTPSRGPRHGRQEWPSRPAGPSLEPGGVRGAGGWAPAPPSLPSPHPPPAALSHGSQKSCLVGLVELVTQAWGRGRASSWHVTKAPLLGRVPFPM